MFGGGIDNDIRALIDGAGKDRGRKDVVDDHNRADSMRDFGHRPDVDQLQRRVRHAFKKHRLGGGGDGGAPLVKVGTIHEGDVNAVPGQHLFQNVKARAEERARRHHMIARPQHGGERAVDGRHARGAGEGGLGAFQCRDPVFEHAHSGVAVAGVDELILARLDKALLGGLGRRVGEALGQENRLGHLAILAAADAVMHEFGACFPIVRHGAPPAQRKTPKPRGPGACASVSLLAACLTWPAIRSQSATGGWICRGGEKVNGGEAAPCAVIWQTCQLHLAVAGHG